MIVQLEKLGDFNKVIEYYKYMLETAVMLDPSTKGKKEQKRHLPEMGYYRAIINNIGISVAQNFDLVERKIAQNDVSEEEINKQIMFELENENPLNMDRSKSKSLEEAFKKIMENYDLTPFQTLKQIRNSLLHGNYSIDFSTAKVDGKTFFQFENDPTVVGLAGKINVHLESQKMQADINYEALRVSLEVLYDNLREKYANDRRIWYITEAKYSSCKNDFFLNQYLKSMKIFYFKSIKEGEQSNVESMLKKYPHLKNILSTIRSNTGHSNFDIEELSEEESNKRKNYIKNYINYIGKNNWKFVEVLPDGIFQELFEDIMLRSSFEDYSNVTGLCNKFCLAFEMVHISQIMNKSFGKVHKDMLTLLSLETPTLYANMLLGMTSYETVFLKENNNDTNVPLFEYHNISGMENVQLSVDTGKEPSIQYNLPGSEKKQKYNNYIESLRDQLKKLKRSASKTYKIKDQLSDKNPKKEELAEKYENSIKELNEQIENVRKRIEQMEVRSHEYDENYMDCSEFFRHMRNSIAHGNVRINYDKAFKRRDLSEIEFTFYDYPNGEYETPEFMVTLNAKKLLKIADGIQSRVNLQLDNESKKEHIADSEILEQYARSFEEKKKNNGDRPKETGLSPERIEEGVYSVEPLETEKVGEIEDK